MSSLSVSNSSARPSNARMVVAALGVVFGDIGTSPLYALREGVKAGSVAGIERSAVVFGVLSLITWSLIVVVTIKYILFILRADNEGEGGILALVTLLRLDQSVSKFGFLLLAAGLAGAAMLFGDGVLTPAISVLSAVEGIEVVAPAIQEYVVPITVLVLIVVFLAQRRGIGPIARFYGPIMVLWFLAIGVFGLLKIIEAPHILAALDPRPGFALLFIEPKHAMLILGSVFLAVTGGEALYADLGQFGRKTIRRAWLFIALPGLILNYFGQGAIYLEQVEVKRSFFEIVPAGFGTPMLILATAATIIASQAILTGAFSLAQQAIELGFLPPMHTRYTSAENEADIYIGRINWLIAVASISIVIGFGSSDALASAYGIAVAITMVTTTILFSVEMLRSWKVPRWAVLLFGAAFLLVDVPFAIANFSKIADGGLLPLTIGAAILLVMGAWRRGLTTLQERHAAVETPLSSLATKEFPGRVLPQAAVFITRSRDKAPLALVRMRRLADVSFKPTVVCAVRVVGRPRVEEAARYRYSELGNDIVRIELFFGYMQKVNLPSILVPILRSKGIDCEDILYIIGMDRVIPSEPIRNFGDFLDILFAFLMDTAERPTDRYALPERRTIAFGAGRHL